VTRGRRIAVDDECVRRWCNEAGDHHVHRRYLASLLTRGGQLVGVNVVQPDGQARSVELTLVTRSGPNQIVTLLPSEGDTITQAMRAAVRLASSDEEVPAGDGA
jgi:hypothetical protein